MVCVCVCVCLCVHVPMAVCPVTFQDRTTDWKNGALTAEYLVQRFQEATKLLADYEALVPRPGWTYVWDRWVNVQIGFITFCHMTVM